MLVGKTYNVSDLELSETNNEAKVNDGGVWDAWRYSTLVGFVEERKGRQLRSVVTTTEREKKREMGDEKNYVTHG